MKTFGLCLISVVVASLFETCAAQNKTWVYDLPPEESAALASIVEDYFNDVPAARKGDDESPLYSLIFRQPLPIPPVKQPTK